ncbi:MAG: hypothetical protein RR776_01550 [Niameybacter sp.]|uniref:hypothetical protein n=1 Tax=Niameybacter sp. TaxID=2033640 RepID=UPI002FC59A07
MKCSNFQVQIGGKEVHGIFGILLAILIAVPILALVGVLLAGIFSVVGVVVGLAVTLAVVVAGIAVIIAVLSLLLPKSWREKLGIHFRFGKERNRPTKSKTTQDGHPIVDVDFEEDKDKN